MHATDAVHIHLEALEHVDRRLRHVVREHPAHALIVEGFERVLVDRWREAHMVVVRADRDVLVAQHRVTAGEYGDHVATELGRQLDELE